MEAKGKHGILESLFLWVWSEIIPKNSPREANCRQESLMKKHIKLALNRAFSKSGCGNRSLRRLLRKTRGRGVVLLRVKSFQTAYRRGHNSHLVLATKVFYISNVALAPLSCLQITSTPVRFALLSFSAAIH